ncbi:MAG: hypothetical protein ILA11_11095 [Butyrivibrio sp.]|nr:hypothetical protein [Butyrivibrio sp.]
MDIYNEVREELNNCYLYVMKDGVITEYTGTMRIFKTVMKKKEFVTSSGKVFKINSYEGEIVANRVWSSIKQKPDVVESLFKTKVEQELEALRKRVSKKTKILRGGFKWQKDM